MKAILVYQNGGPEQLRYEDCALPAPGEREALIRVEFAGVNYIDTYQRSGLYPVELPCILGREASGIVEEIGPNAESVAVGDRVAYAMTPGAYAEYSVVPDWQLVKVPASVSSEIAASVMLQGMTAHYLTHSTFPLGPGHTCLVHAAAGGTGQLIVQMAKIRGARVFGTASTYEKAELARRAGCDEVIVYTEKDFAAEAKRLTEDRGVDVVYDGVGAATWEGSLDSLRIRGMMVSFGNASGPVPDIKPLVLSQKGSLFLTRPTLFHYCTNRDEVSSAAGDILGWLSDNKLRVLANKIYPLAEAADAHRDLEGRRSVGKLLLKP